jgi:hypothetical protein
VLLRECVAVLGLLYQLTFYLIEYIGPYTDLGTCGWPLRQYSLKQSEDTGQTRGSGVG